MDFIPGFNEVPFEVYLERSIILMILCFGIAYLPISKTVKLVIVFLLVVVATISVLVTWELLFL
jgi:hypothetical protein